MPAAPQVLLRKGGIREPTFVPAARRFLLFPTAFHADAALLKPGVAEQFHEVRLRVLLCVRVRVLAALCALCVGSRGREEQGCCSSGWARGCMCLTRAMGC
jgi:hypothetical protein